MKKITVLVLVLFVSVMSVPTVNRNGVRPSVPLILGTDGPPAAYYQDVVTPEKSDFIKLEKIARTLFALSRKLTKRPLRR